MILVTPPPSKKQMPYKYPLKTYSAEDKVHFAEYDVQLGVRDYEIQMNLCLSPLKRSARKIKSAHADSVSRGVRGIKQAVPMASVVQNHNY